jgi:hypothetical protein
MPVQRVTHNDRYVDIYLDSMIAVTPDGVYSRAIICMPGSMGNYELRGGNRVLLQEIQWETCDQIAVVADTSMIFIDFSDDQGRRVNLLFEATHTQRAITTTRINHLAHAMRRRLRCEKQLAVMMATHPRLGQQCPLAGVPEIVDTIARNI